MKWYVTLISALLGILDSIYLTWVKITNSYATCVDIGNCEAVNNSSYSEFAGIPIAILGAGAYAFIVLLLLIERKWNSQSDNMQLGIFGVALIGTLYSAYLTYVEIAILNAICPYCILSALLMTVVLIVSILRLREGEIV
jgi:uncharacterized membrane protein